MASKKVEKAHVSELRRVLSATGIACGRTEPESTESSISSREIDTTEHIEEQLQAEVEEFTLEEQKPEAQEEIAEEQPEIFPSRSLRRVLPERIRNIEGQNTIHVLPEKFHSDIDPNAIPKIVNTAPKKYIEDLAKIVGCKSYMSSLAEFWFLDTLANLLRRAQEDKLDKRYHAVSSSLRGRRKPPPYASNGWGVLHGTRNPHTPRLFAVGAGQFQTFSDV
ncbi:hypothetical protein ACJJTC_014177 [Scirpophaga incertulas]